MVQTSDDPIRSISPSPSSSSVDSNVALPSLLGIAPTRPPTTVEAEETVVDVPYLSRQVRLKVDAGPGCGGIAWPAGEVLSRYIAHRFNQDSTFLHDRKVLELGSGTGLVGIVAGILDSSADVWVTDQEVLLDLMSRNVQHNNVEQVHVAEYNWGEEVPSDIPIDEIDMVLAADCVYFEPAFPLLVKTLCDLAPIDKKIEILFCWKKRRKADKRFSQLLKRHFDSEIVDDDKEGEREKYNREGVSLIRLKRRK